MTQHITGAFAATFATIVLAVAPASATTTAPDFQFLQSEKVQISDLNLSRQTDVSKLYSRLRKAAAHVCVVGGSSVIDHIDEACRTRAVGDAVVAINNAALTALHEHRAPLRSLAAN